MKPKLTEMSKPELLSYMRKWEKKRERFLPGSRNDKKATRRIRKAEHLLLG